MKLFMPAALTVFAALAALTASGSAHADAELRLFAGPHESDLKNKIVIDSFTGEVRDHSYQKVCSAYNGCKAVETGMNRFGTIPKKELNELNSVTGLPEVAPLRIAGEAARKKLCRFFTRFSYHLPMSDGRPVEVAAFGSSCSGSREAEVTDTSSVSRRATVSERVLNIAAEKAGL